MGPRAPTPFVVLTSPRTGSAWVIDSLDSHPEVVAYAELFLGDGVPVAYAGADMPKFDDYVSNRPVFPGRARPIRRIAYLRKLYRYRPGVRAVGFKLMYAQVPRQSGILPYLSLRRARAIHLIRANTLEALISYRLAKATGVFHPNSRGDPVETRPITLDVVGLRERLEKHDLAVARARATIERYRVPRLEIAYEELLGRQEETFSRIVRFLGVDPDVAPLRSVLVRSGTGRNIDLVENVNEVRGALTGTRFAWMLDSPGGGRRD